MKISKLQNILSKLDPNMQIIGFDAYNECLTKIVKFEVVEHSGIEHNCWHYEQTFESGVPAGAYLQINCGD